MCETGPKSQLTAQAARSQSSCHCQQLFVGPPGPTPPSNYGWVSERKEPRREYLQPGQCTPATIQNQPSARGEELRLAFSSLPAAPAQPQPTTHTPSQPLHLRLVCLHNLLPRLSLLPLPPSQHRGKGSPGISVPLPAAVLLIIASDLVRILFLPPCSSFPSWYLCSDVNYGYHSQAWLFV